MPWVAAAMVASNVVGGMMAKSASKKGQAAAAEAMAQARAEIEKVGAPPDLSKAIILEKLQEAGVLTPAMEQKISAGISQLSEYKEDTQGKEAQTNALRLMTQASREGLGATERADLNKLRTQAAIDAEAKRQQLMQSLQSRGIAGSGSELASQLSAQQGGYQTASEEGDRMAAQAQTRALQAMLQSSNMGQSLRTSDLQYAQATKGAADEFQKFDVANQVSQQSRNIGATNNAQATNLQNKQRIQDVNTADQNQEKRDQLVRQRNYWQDKLAYAQALAAPATQQAQIAAAGGQNQASILSGIGNAVSSGIGSAYTGGMFGGNKAPKEMPTGTPSPLGTPQERNAGNYK